MSVDKAKDTSPKKAVAENKIVEAKPESSTMRATALMPCCPFDTD
jgi:hypothetical protein